MQQTATEIAKQYKGDIPKVLAYLSGCENGDVDENIIKGTGLADKSVYATITYLGNNGAVGIDWNTIRENKSIRFERRIVITEKGKEKLKGYTKTPSQNSKN